MVRDNGVHALALTYSMKNLYNVAAGKGFWAASDVRWVVGQSYIVYGPDLCWLYDYFVRRQAGAYAGCRNFLANIV